jgi:hypothetical protein
VAAVLLTIMLGERELVQVENPKWLPGPGDQVCYSLIVYEVVNRRFTLAHDPFYEGGPLVANVILFVSEA